MSPCAAQPSMMLASSDKALTGDSDMFGPKELMVVLIVLVIVLMVFGPKRIKSLGS